MSMKWDQFSLRKDFMFRNKLDDRFKSLKQTNKKALIAYLAAGYPKFSEQEKIIEALVKSGVDVLELGIPFSDPIADGPTIQFASQEALKNGASITSIMPWVKKWTKKFDVPILLMTYANPIYRYGLKKFSSEARQAGVSGVIVPDLIVEESKEFEEIFSSQKLHLVQFISPTTPKNRQKFISKKTSGFLYAVSVAGVTGARKSFGSDTVKWLRSLKGLTKVPVCVGFGIAGIDQIKQLKPGVDGFIVGSALIDRIRNNKPQQRISQITKFMSQLSKECSHGS